jgi:hypothetical protein
MRPTLTSKSDRSGNDLSQRVGAGADGLKGLTRKSLREKTCALVAQLDRASDFESEGREFESLRARHHLSLQLKGFLRFPLSFFGLFRVARRCKPVPANSTSYRALQFTPCNTGATRTIGLCSLSLRRQEQATCSSAASRIWAEKADNKGGAIRLRLF